MHNCILARSLAAVMCKFLWPNAPVVGVEKKFSHLAGVTTSGEGRKKIKVGPTQKYERC
jgi:hypothetical protein